jgi:predicted DCC family thiol-disulfide oxidoreductase YuxK
LRLLKRLGLPWSLTWVFILVPRPLRDAVYRWIARNRYRWFGARKSCMVPSAELRSRFLD